MFPASLLTTLLLALAVFANPVVVDKSRVKLPLTRHLNLTSVHNLHRHDYNRAQFLKSRHGSTAAVVSTPEDNQAVVYAATVGIGSPATDYSLLIDTGSSNTWVGAGTAYAKTSTSATTGQSVSVTYGSGSFSGTEYTDTVTIASNLVITKQSIGDASTSSGFTGFDGILGIGPLDLTQGTLSPDTSATIPTVTGNLFSQGTISANEIGISFEPTTSESDENGEITWGGTDSSKYTGSITYTPLTTTSPASFYWGINESITYGSSKTSILSETAGIVDTGTTLLLIATNALATYQKLTGATLDSTTGLLTLTTANFNKLESLYFTISGTTFEYTANAQLWPRSLNTYIGGTAGDIYLIVGDIGSDSGSGLDFINGYAWLERFYAVFDTANSRIGFATTSFTDATTN